MVLFNVLENHKGYLIFICLYVWVAKTALCQNKIDSLEVKTYQELNDLSIKAIDNSDTTRLFEYRNYHLKKAKAEQNNLEIAHAYFSFISWENFENDIKYSDSIIAITQNSKSVTYPTNGYLVKAQLYYFDSDFNKALDNYIIASEWAVKKQYKPMQIEADIGIASIKNVWGLHEEALIIYRSIYSDIIKMPRFLENDYDDYILLVNNLSLSYIRNNKPDSALVILKNAFTHVKIKNDSLAYYDLVKTHATANFYLKKYPQTHDSLIKFSSKYSNLVLADSYYMLGKIYQYRNNKKLLINYFKKIDSINLFLNDPFPELKEVYKVLYENAIEIKNKDKQLYYLNQLLAADSILDENFAKINRKVYTEIDIPNLNKEKHQLAEKLDNRQQLLFISITSVIILSLFLVHYYKRQQKLKVKFQKLLQGDVLTNSEMKTQEIKNSTLAISKHITEEVLENLSKFENSKGFLRNDITLASLAKDYNTNSSYLSSIINHIKQVNFATYLKNLRINNAINSIKKEKTFLKYSIQGLAEEFGFTTAESFSKAFREKTGIKPSYFLNKLRKENDSDT